jgi:phosphoserine phosphatase RsbU/P
MRDRVYLALFLLLAGLLIYVGHDYLTRSVVVTSALAFAGTVGVALMGTTLYRVQHELRASRSELARKQAELNFALEVQRALFPKSFPANSGLEFSAVCVPASGISGDYYDVLQASDSRVIFAVGDISGKGISAAILMSNVHAVLRMLAARNLDPSEVLSQLNAHLYQITDDYRFATFFYGDWDSQRRMLRYINAGHTVPPLFQQQGQSRLEMGGYPLGMFALNQFEVGEVALQPGDLVALYSDGVTEAASRTGELFGERRFEAIIASSLHKTLAEIQSEVLSAVRNWAGPDPEDDMTLLLVRAVGPSLEQV